MYERVYDERKIEDCVRVNLYVILLWYILYVLLDYELIGNVNCRINILAHFPK